MEDTNNEDFLENNNTKVGNSENHTGSKGNGRFHINRNLIPLKITLFLFYGAMSAILPYLTIHMKEIGISLPKIGIIYAVLPFTAFMGPPLIGFMADKLGQYKAVLVIATIVTGVSHTLLLTVPKYSESLVYSEALIEFNTVYYSGYVEVRMRPTNSSHCKHFTDSLQNSQSDNGIIQIHSCRWGEGGDQSNPLASGVIKLWNIPSLCRHQISKASHPQSNDYDDPVQSLICGNNLSDLSYTPNGMTSSKTDFPTHFTQSIDTKCSVLLQINGLATGQGVQQQVTCLTNHTFPTGQVMENGNAALTFWIYLLIRIVSNMFLNSCFTLFDATALTVVKMNPGSDYGKQRIFSVLGFATISPLAGLVVDTVSKSKGYTDYSSAFYIADGMLCLNLIGYVFMKLKIEKPKENMWKDAAGLLRYPEVIVFLIMIFFIGNMWGFIESYLFIFLDELQAPKYLLGLTQTVGSLVSVPFLYGAAGLVAKVGRANIIALAFIAYFVRFFGYSFIPNAYWCFPFEAMEALTFHLMWAAAVTYCAVLAPKGLIGTLTGITGSLHYGLGKGSGAFIGGYVIDFSSTRQAFRYFGIFAGAIGVIYFLIEILWLKAVVRNREDSKSDEQKENEKKLMMLKDGKK